MNTQWYYAHHQVQKGPVEQTELVAKIRSGEIAAGDLVWREGMTDWTECGNLPELTRAAGVVPMSMDPASGAVSPYAPPQSVAAPPAPGLPVGSGKATACLVLGVVSMVFGMSGLMCCPGAFVAVPCGILAVVFASQVHQMALRHPLSSGDLGKVKAGQILGWIGLGIGGLWLLALLGGSL